MLEEQRCEFEDELFAKYSINGYKCDGSPRCWVRGAAPFTTVKGDKFYCLLHAPEEIGLNSYHHKWPLAERGKQQTRLFLHLLSEWIEHNKNLKNGIPTSLILPNIHCGEVRFAASSFIGEIHLEKAVFKGDTSFLKVVCEDNVFLDGAIFKGYTLFSDVEFKENVSLKQATFEGDAQFHRVSFYQPVWFTSTIFLSVVDFHQTRFARFLTINRAKFLGTLNLVDTTLEFPAYLSKCWILRLNYRSHSGARIFFNGCRTVDIQAGVVKDIETGEPLLGLLKGSNRSSRNDGGVLSFQGLHCEHITFQNMNLSHADFRGADVSKTRFISCRWKKPGGMFYPKVWGHPRGLQSEREDTLNLELFKNIYEQLKNNLEEHREFLLAGVMHYQEMELRRWQLQERILGKISSLSGWLKACTRVIPELSMLWLYRVTADYGESYVKLAITIFASLCLTTWGVGHYEGTLGGWQAFWFTFENVLFSLVPSGFQKETLTALKLTDASKWVMLTEVVALLTLVPLFVMAVRRRFRR